MTADRSSRWSGGPPTMRDVSHAHAEHNPRAFHWFSRGPLIVADGGAPGDDSRGNRGRRDDEADDRPARDVEDERLRDVSHEPADGEGANRVWERGDDQDEGSE